MIPNVKIDSVSRVKGGTRICGTIDVDGPLGPIPGYPVCVVLKDSLLKRAVLAARDEARRFAKRVAGWFRRG